MNTSNRSKVLEGFTEAAGGVVNPAVQGWKDGGGKVVGYFCSSVPEEIISAAGLLPVRIRATGSTETDLADAYFRPTTCSFARHCFDTALRGGYGFADGVVWANTCDVIRRLYDNWKEEIDAPFLQILSLPKKTGPKQVAWYREELGNLRKPWKAISVSRFRTSACGNRSSSTTKRAGFRGSSTTSERGNSPGSPGPNPWPS